MALSGLCDRARRTSAIGGKADISRNALAGAGLAKRNGPRRLVLRPFRISVLCRVPPVLRQDREWSNTQTLQNVPEQTYRRDPFFPKSALDAIAENLS
jgi:hypothetical protein